MRHLELDLNQSDSRYSLTKEVKADTPIPLHMRTHRQSPTKVPALIRAPTPAFKHAINLVANCVAGIAAVKSPHKKSIIFGMSVAYRCHHRCSQCFFP